MRVILLISFCGFAAISMAQKVGDTITVKTFNYSQTYGTNQWSPGIRDSIIDFSTLPNVQFERVLMTYNLRCKDAKVSNSNNRDRGCGEWDISCNTYIHDTTKIDSVPSLHPNYIISGFSGSDFDFTETQPYDYFEYNQNDVIENNIKSEKQFDLFADGSDTSQALSGSQKSGKAHFLYTKDELLNAGFAAGKIDGLKLKALNEGKINYFRVRIKQISYDSLDINKLYLDEFSQVFFSNYAFVKGENRIHFTNPFDWNGTDNLLFEFCFTNSSATKDVELSGSSTTKGKAAIANNNFSIDLSANGHIDVPTASLSSIKNEITMSFWAFGSDDLPTNTSAVYGAGPNNERQINTHLPWSNGNVYWDCGNADGSYDRIEKTASPADFKGKWSHWAFTKNSTSGNMKIYLNGKLWHSGTDKKKPINLASLIIGKGAKYANNYKGSLDEFRIWNKELSEKEIGDWMNISINENHPNYKNLVSYYPIDEGNITYLYNEQNPQDTARANQSIIWNFNRGIAIDRFFSYTNVRPNISLFQGDYDTTVVTNTVLDSLPLAPKSVVEYRIDKKPGTLQDDAVIKVSEKLVWQAIPQVVYQGESDTKLRYIPITKTGTYQIKDLKYQRRWAAKFEIMSFVTPYGINLDLGKNGKTWTFDVTDFLPLFEGKKRMTIERGGQWMEDMNIQFHFIVGTPVRDVLDIQQIWKAESRGYAAINANTYFAPKDIDLNAEGKYFAIRSTITGHGQEGEFIPQNHHLFINGKKEFSWQVWKECAENPIYPQGGTWVYDRAGWCPGAASELELSDISAFTAGKQTVNLDYDVDVASGDSRYIVNHQLISYGAINHGLDARLLEVKNPSNRVEFARFNSNCHAPTVIIQNTGSTDLTKATISYWINDSKKPLSQQWEGKLGFLETAEVSLNPSAEFWKEANTSGNVFHAEITKANGSQDEYAANNIYHSSFELPEVLPRDFIIQLRTNSKPAENSYEVLDFNGNKIFSRTDLQANTLYRDTIHTGLGCYTLNVLDFDDDGLSWWANDDGRGSVDIREISGRLIKTFNPDFGDNIRYNFTIDYPLVYEDINPIKGLSVYPNPAQSNIHIQFEGKTSQPFLQIIDFKGRVIYEQNMNSQDLGFNLNYSLDGLTNGFYLVKVTDGGTSYTSKFVKK